MAEEIVPIANWFALHESPKRPAVIFGFSSDRIGTEKETYQVYGTLAKSFPKLHLAPYVSLQYSGTDKTCHVPFGVSIPIGSRYVLQPIYDGHRSHLMGTVYLSDRVGLTALWVWYERAGVAMFAGF